MRRRLRQAGFVTGQIGHHGLRLIGTLLLVGLLLAGAAAWRLSRGPVDLPPLAARIGAAVSGAISGVTVTIGHAGLAWEGFRRGGAPLDLRLSDIAIHDHSGVVTARISRLRVTLALRALVNGRIAPVRVFAREPDIAFRPVIPAANAVSVPPEAMGVLLSLLAEVPKPGGLDLSSLRRIRIANAHLDIKMPGDPSAFIATDGALSFTRARDTTLEGTATARFTHGASVIPLSLTVAGHDGLGRVTARLGPFDPARLLPADNPFAGFDLPVTLSARWPVGRFVIPRLDLGLNAGAGRIAAGTSKVPVASIIASAEATADRVRIDHATVQLAAPKDARGPTVTLGGTMSLHGRLPGTLDIGIDRVEAGALPHYWPAGVAQDARNYVTQHIRKGIARDGNFHVVFNLADGDLAPGAMTGEFSAKGVAVDWFGKAPPIADLDGTLRFTRDDAIDIAAKSGRYEGLAVRGTMRITTLSKHDQDASIKVDVDGPLARAIRALKAPPLRLKASGLQLDHASGNVAATIETHLPLKKHLAMADVAIKAHARLSKVHLPLPVSPLALDDGMVTLDVDPRRLALKGAGKVEGSKADFTASMALPEGRLHLVAHTLATRASLAPFGFKPAFWQAGAAPLTLSYRETATGGQLDVGADLTGVTLAAPSFGWRKAKGVRAHATASLAFAHGRLAGFDAVSVEAPALAFDARRDGASIAVSDLRLGTLAARGTLTPPAGAGLPWRVALNGNTLDLSALIADARKEAGRSSATASGTAAKDDTPWRLSGAFDHLRLHAAPAPLLGAARIEAHGDAADIAALTSDVQLSPGAGAKLSYATTADGTEVKLDADDAGILLAALDATGEISGGKLDLSATRQKGITKGKLAMTDFRVRHAPIIAKILQGVTIYGMPAAASGPGIAFSSLTAPFSIEGSTISLGGARASSPSLGLTATGKVELGAKRYDLSGTIVPFYALNTLPGRIPLIGRLFSPEKGGGLFAARYTVVGPFARPDISVNPVSILTPGFIRDLFGTGAPETPAAKPINP